VLKRRGGGGGEVLNSCKKRGYMVRVGQWGGEQISVTCTRPFTLLIQLFF